LLRVFFKKFISKESPEIFQKMQLRFFFCKICYSSYRNQVNDLLSVLNGTDSALDKQSYID
jgi:hypothetical protein